MKVCGNTVSGSGLAHVEIAFPEQAPINVNQPAHRLQRRRKARQGER